MSAGVKAGTAAVVATPDKLRTHPTATLRLQLHEGYTLDDARADLGYFSRLGISHLYLSPVSRARRGSTHGYDVVDHGVVSAALGGEQALRRLAQQAHSAGMGLLLDIVPNHMATDPDNVWWWDVLEHGPKSAWAEWFDIDWQAPELPGKVLAPFLEQHYAQALSGGDIRLQHDAARGFHITAHGVPYPLAPATRPASGNVSAVLVEHDPARPDGRQHLHGLLEKQHYRLAWWRCAADIINWRRFFEVSGLIGVRVESVEVFDAVHELPLRLYAEGLIDGLRVDHVDGLACPLAYCRRLHAAMLELRSQRPAALRGQPPWIVVEKILADGETLDARWEISGTTGYDFCADVGALLHDAAGEIPLFAGWARIADDRRPVQEWLVGARRELLGRHFSAERGRLLDALAGLAGQDAATRDWTRPAIGRVLDAVLCHYPVYRSYVEDEPRCAADQRWFDQALRGAAKEVKRDTGLHETLLPLLDLWLGGAAPASELAAQAVTRFQQLTPPLAAKSLEDTVFYRYGCLLSRNEVGSDPAVFALRVEAFHQSNLRRAATAPRGLLATATHDHKRGEDLRARLAVLSEMPQEWLNASSRWMNMIDTGAPPQAGEAAFRYMLLQTLVGAWPVGLCADDAEGMQHYFDRIGQWATKALREGKQHSSWFEPDTEQEAAQMAYLNSMAPGGPAHAVLYEMQEFVRRIEPGAIANGIVQAALRMSCPGIPDLYQGTEFRDFSLVDPDNRRPVDFAARAKALAEAEQEAAYGEQLGSLLQPSGAPTQGATTESVDWPERPLLESGARPVRPPLGAAAWPAAAWSDGRVKQAVIACLLRLRQEHSGAFSGAYRPLALTGDRSHEVVAFTREDDIIVIAAVKCASQLRFNDQGMPVLPMDYWGEAVLPLPPAEGGWRDMLRGRRVGVPGEPAHVADLLAGFPLAVLCRDQG